MHRHLTNGVLVGGGRVLVKNSRTADANIKVFELDAEFHHVADWFGFRD